jgi:hypothetical protein
MKKLFLILVIAGFLLIGLSEVQAQTNQTNLNQTELIKQFIGSWKLDMGKDTTGIVEIKSFGTGIEPYFKVVTKGKIVTEVKELLGYDKKIDKYIEAYLEKGKDIEIYALWFISTTKYIITNYSDFANPDKASFKEEGEFKTPNLLVATSYINGKLLKNYKFTLIK